MNEERSNRLLELNSFAALHFHQNLLALPSEHPAKLWLANRGIGPEAVELFKIGFAANNWWDLPNALNSEEYALTDGQAVGLLRLRESPDDRGSHFSVFNNRVMFPVENYEGKIFGFIGRDVESEFGPKYLSSARSVTLPYCEQFFGFRQAMDSIKETGQVIVVEGVTSAIALHMAGFKNVVSILGIGFHPDQAKVLKELGVEVIGWFDGDECGWLGLYRFLHMLRNRQIPAKGIWIRRIPKPREHVKRMGPQETGRQLSKALTFEELFKSSRPVEPED
jgi:DNA primase